MLLFLDTEFTDFVDCHLISIGLVSEDGRQFYCERNDYPDQACSEFVRFAVLPHLGKRSEYMVNRDELKQRLAAWLEQFRNDEPTFVAFDYRGDWDLFRDALDTAIPEWICGANVRHQISELLVQQYFKDTGLCPHHALHDALANRFAYSPEPEVAL